MPRFEFFGFVLGDMAGRRKDYLCTRPGCVADVVGDDVSGFPISLVCRVHCTLDGGALRPRSQTDVGSAGAIRSGSLVCDRCGHLFSIIDGILNLLGEAELDSESRHEQHLRNQHARAIDSAEQRAPDDDHNLMEILPTLEALSLNADHEVLELGCGEGRFTLRLAQRAT